LAESKPQLRIKGFNAAIAKDPAIQIVVTEDARWDMAISERNRHRSFRLRGLDLSHRRAVEREAVGVVDDAIENQLEQVVAITRCAHDKTVIVFTQKPHRNVIA
jgi:polysaccharide pyruvyl transferase WcaK-like protein